VHVVARIDHAEIAGDEEAVWTELGLGLLRHAPIALEHVRALHLDHADLALRHERAGFGIGDTHADARQREADGAGDAVAVIGVRRDHVGFGHAVAFENGVADPRSPFAMRFGEQRRGARHEQAHVRGRLLRQALVRQQACVEGRHAHQAGGARHVGHDLVDVELRRKIIVPPAISSVLIATNRPWV